VWVPLSSTLSLLYRPPYSACTYMHAAADTRRSQQVQQYQQNASGAGQTCVQHKCCMYQFIRGTAADSLPACSMQHSTVPAAVRWVLMRSLSTDCKRIKDRKDLCIAFYGNCICWLPLA
jgi:hypothetical protein